MRFLLQQPWFEVGLGIPRVRVLLAGGRGCPPVCMPHPHTPAVFHPPPGTFRCEALEARCLELETGSQALAEQLAAAQEELAVVSAQRAALEEQLGEARLQMAQLEQQQETFASVQQVCGCGWAANCWMLSWAGLSGLAFMPTLLHQRLSSLVGQCARLRTLSRLLALVCPAAPERAGDGAAHLWRVV